MASVRKNGRYEEHDLVDEFLLNQVAKYVNYLKLCSFAKDLGVTQTEYDKITAPNTFTQDEQIHKVLDAWRQQMPPDWQYTVKHLLEDVHLWVNEGHVLPSIRDRFRDYINPELTPVPEPISRRSHVLMTEEDLNNDLELTDAQLVLLSNEITSQSKLRTLATVGLNMNSGIISYALQNNRDDITEAVHTVLTQWRDSQPNKSIAYTRICEALRRVKMKMLIVKMLEDCQEH